MQQSPARPRIADAQAMLAAMANPALRFEVTLNGFPGWLRLPDDWIVNSPPQQEHLFYFVAAGEFAADDDRDEGPQTDPPAQSRPVGIEAGTLVWIPAGTPFHFWIPPGCFLQAYRFRLRIWDADGKSTENASAGATPRAVLHPAAWPVQTWARQIAEEAGHHDAFRGERLRGLLLCFFTELARLTPGRHRGTGRLTREQQESLVQYFAARARTRPTPADLAGHLRLSLDYFTRVFRRTFGRPPRHWMVEQRIQQAALRLMESRLTISEVADEFGYDSIFAFSRQFKSVLGVSPAKYREQESGVARMRK